jgi:hypothetical protein
MLRVSALPTEEDVQLPGSALMIFVRPRCVASRRLMTLIDDKLDLAKSAVPVVLAVVGDPAEARRLAATSGQRALAHVQADRLPAEIIDSIPCAVMLASGRRVRHAGGMSNAAAVARFAEACGDKRTRQWFNGLPAEPPPK